MASTTNQTSASDKQPDGVHQLSLASNSANTQKWKDAKKDFWRRRVEEKVQEAAAAEKTGLPTDASKVSTEADKDTGAEEVPGVAAAEKRGVYMEA